MGQQLCMLWPMLIQIASLLLDVISGLLAGLCVLRAYLGGLRVPLGRHSGNPLGPLIMGLTDWLVLPLRKALPSARRLDVSSLLAAYFIVLVKLALLALLGIAPWSVTLLLWAGFDLLHLVVSGLFGLAIVAVILSWVQSSSPMALLIDRMVEPILHPIRRILPTFGGIDLSPLVLLLLLQVVDMVLRSLRWSL